MSRWIWFLFSIIIGIGLGLAYGWVLNPPGDQDTSPDTLRIDFKTDYVLMVSESFKSDSDPQLALQRLSLLGGPQPELHIQEALQFAQKVGYSEKDIGSIQTLLSSLQSHIPSQVESAP